MKPGPYRLVGALIIASAGGAALVQAQGRGGEWTTSQGDAQRSSWVRSDVRLTKEAVQKGELKFLWKMKLDNETRQLNSLTTPVLMDRLISHRGFKALAFIGASAERVYAMGGLIPYSYTEDSLVLVRLRPWPAAQPGR